MIRKLGLATASLTLAGATLLLGAGTASAQPPIGGCPSGDGWNLVPIEFTIAEDVGNFHDQNGDGWVCQRDNPGLSFTNPFTVWTVTDNTN
jgi:hypothetical protein